MALHTSSAACANSKSSNLGQVAYDAVKPNYSPISSRNQMNSRIFMPLEVETMVLHSISFTACANSSSSGLMWGAVKSDRRYTSSSRNTLSKFLFGSASRWTVPSSWSSCSRSKGFQHARAAIELPHLESDDQIPPLSTILHYLTPIERPSSYADEAESILSNIASGWGMNPNPIIDIYKTVGVECAMYFHPRTATADRLAALSLFYFCYYVLDEAFFDISDLRLVAMAEEFGIDTTMRHDRSRMGSFWKKLANVFRSTELPPEAVPVEKAVWETGRLMRSLGATEAWFDNVVEDVKVYALSSFEFHFHGGSEVTSHQELEAYIERRVGNAGVSSVCCSAELATGKLLSAEARNHPQVQRLKHLCCRYATLQNDLCSYHKEASVDKDASHNTLQVLMINSLSLAQAVQWVIDFMLADCREFLELEQDPQIVELAAVYDGLADYIQGLKDIMTGGYEYHRKGSRYRTVDNPFPEMRL